MTSSPVGTVVELSNTRLRWRCLGGVFGGEDDKDPAQGGSDARLGADAFAAAVSE